MIDATQPQLLQMALNPGDVVYTPDFVARDMVQYFQPSGRILEPCCGDGVFLKYLPAHAEWCEIERGVDFFTWHDQVDWCFGNPPYKTFEAFMGHSMEISKNIVYIVPTNKIFQSLDRLKKIIEWGGLKSFRVYGGGEWCWIPIRFFSWRVSLSARLHWRDYDNDVR